ncbi:MAG: signal peptidase I [Methylococcaceae bacterium]|nr:signal peptidase I [Methylococcaceae bacterium]
MDFDFSFFLVVASLLTGLVWGGWALYLKLQPQSLRPEPILVEYARSFFPVIFFVLLLRAFLVEPFRIPSASMMPTLLIGDFILVNKFTYGIRLPVLNQKIIEMNEPKRGDIVVFRFPKDPSVNYIKRVIGLPGDRIGYFNKQIFVNGKPVKSTPLAEYRGAGQGANATGAILLTEDLESVNHDILIHQGQASREGEFSVPAGQYFVMGDNRDNSNDSRYWGTAPEANLVGKAFFIWMNFDWALGGFPVDFSRIGTSLK